MKSYKALRVADFKVDGNSQKPIWRNASKFKLLNAVNGKKCTNTTIVSILHSTGGLYVLFEAIDRHIWGTYQKNDDPIWQEEAVEVFLAVKNLQEYFEIQFSPQGVKYDAKVLNPTGCRYNKNFSVDVSWDCGGLEFAQKLKIEEDFGNYKAGKWFTEIFIPFKSIGITKLPKSIRANFFRVDGWPKQNNFQAWSPTFKNPPDFHIPEKFGIIWLI